MSNNKIIPVIFLLALLAALAGPSGCRRSSANEKRYDLKGTVVAVEKDKRLVTISHGDIKDYMPGMVMPFTVKEDSALEILVPGDQVQATLVVDGPTSWIENVFVTRESPAATTPQASGPAEAKAGDEVPNFALLNQDGKEIRIRNYRGKVLMLTFIYTRCPDPNQCTLMSSNFATIDQQLQKQPELYKNSHLLSISFDPDYDTPKVLRSYGAAHTGRYTDETFDHWEFATGTKEAVKGLAQFFGMRYFHDTTSGEESVVHSLRTAIITPEGKIFKVYRGNEWKPDEAISDLLKAQQPAADPKITPVDHPAATTVPSPGITGKN
jgi:protein SCO1/2